MMPIKFCLNEMAHIIIVLEEINAICECPLMGIVNVLEHLQTVLSPLVLHDHHLKYKKNHKNHSALAVFKFGKSIQFRAQKLNDKLAK